MTKKNIELTAMPTPNPNSIKFLINAHLLESGSIDFSSKEKAKGSPLIETLFSISGICGVMIGTNFISISKESQAGWETVLEDATNTIKTMLKNEDLLIKKELIEALKEKNEEDSDTVKKIKEILDNEIRPAIAMDGGDCQFIGFEDGIVRLELQGACSSCPSAVMTLKMGIENRLKEDIPEVEEVIQV